MHLDVQELYDFYRSLRGQVARRLIAHHIRAFWPDVSQENLLGIGYAVPFVRPFLAEAQRLVLAMPEEQGVIRWPHDQPSCTVLANERQLPLADASMHKVLAIHSLETSDAPNLLLRELWRVLMPEGRLLLIVPNRRGLWARFDTTPFGQGHPYSRRQLEQLLGDCMYAPTSYSPGLFMPPMSWKIILKTAVAWERAGLFAWPSFSGILMVEAQKNLYAPLRPSARIERRKNTETVPRPGMQITSQNMKIHDTHIDSRLHPSPVREVVPYA